MQLFKSIFWNRAEKRLRSFWRLVVFLIIVAILANPPVMLLDSLDSSVLNSSFTNLFVMLAFLLGLWITAKYIEKVPFKNYGFHINGLWWKQLGMGFLFGSALIGIIFLTLLVFGWVGIEFKRYSKYPEHLFLLLFLGQCIRFISGSVFEETFSRGFLIRNIAEGFQGERINSRKAILAALLITSFSFGALHFFNPDSTLLSTINLTLLGILFGLAYLFTGNLAFPIGLHLGWNVFQNIVFGFANSGKPPTVSLMTVQLSGPGLWTGGSFGLEGSFITTLIIVLAICALLFYHRKNDPKLEFKVLLTRFSQKSE